jgi:hypothetical protein
LKKYLRSGHRPQSVSACLFFADDESKAVQPPYFYPTSSSPQVYHPAGWSDGEEYGSLVKVDKLPPKPEQPKDQLDNF